MFLKKVFKNFRNRKKDKDENEENRVGNLEGKTSDKSYKKNETIEGMPKHIAIILDGNGRWATKRNLPKVAGHYAGRQALKNIVRGLENTGVRYLTLYAFSTENWKRSEKEIEGLFKIFMLAVKHDLKELAEHDVKIKFLGDISIFPDYVVKGLEESLEMTKNNTGFQINIAVNYGGRLEITRATKKIAEAVKLGEIQLEDIDENTIGKYLYTGEYEADVPDPELIIRTSGEKRLSNYLLWQSAYSELVFSEVLWPDFTWEEFEKCIEEFKQRNRRFGGR